MSPEAGAPSLASRFVVSSDTMDAPGSLVSLVASQATTTDAARVMATGLAARFQTPFAVLSRGGSGWRFEADGFPDAAATGGVTRSPPFESGSDPVQQWEQNSGTPWTGIALAHTGDRDWLLLAPGTSTTWGARPGFYPMVEQLGWSLRAAAAREHDDYVRRFARRLHAFGHRLAREEDGKLHAIVLRALATHVRARTGALAVYNDLEQALAIVATHGYPRALVEHLRIAQGEGIMGRAYQSGKPLLGRPDDHSGARRLRYRTSSYMALPIMAGRRPLAVVTLTDRADGRDFDERDFSTARILATTAAPGLTRERVSQNFGELTRMATVDALTGLFNRRYFESRFVAEVERARRQKQDLALLMIDIDDFKRINDNRGHLEGDRALHDVADLLRQSVRIFDVCVRFGGEEFAIIMPGASPAVAMQVAERIRGRVERHFSHDALPVTVSVGVGMLEPDRGSHDLIEVADNALLAAKAGGKNIVRVDGQSRSRTRHTP